MENYKNEGGFLSAVLNLLKITILLFLVYLYFEKWIRSAKEGKWLLFTAMSVIPAMMIYAIIEKINSDSNNVYHDMVDAQIKAWKRQNK